jgi:hypothetical protein
MAPLLDTLERKLLSQGLRKKGEIFVRRTFNGESKRHIKKGSGNGQLSP